MGKEDFLEFVKDVSKELQKWFEISNNILVISHIDADGISSATQVVLYLYEIEKNAKVKFVQYLDKDFLKKILSESYDLIVFLDLGSSYYKEIKKNSFGKRVVILDHHEPETREKVRSNMIHINPRLFGLNGDLDISSSGITYLVFKNLSYNLHKIAFLSLVGALGDLQETNEGFQGLNKDILKELVDSGIIEVKKGLKIFGIFTRPLHKALEYSAELVIPGVTGSEIGAMSFLQELGIPLKKGSDWIKYSELTDSQLKKLISGIILRRLKGKIPDAENVLGNLYILRSYRNPLIRELREISYLLNACGRLGKYGVAVGAMLGDEKYIDMLLDIQLEYKKEILKALQMFDKNEVDIKTYGKIIWIDFGDKIRSTLVSPIASLLQANQKIANYNVLIVSAKDKEGFIKVSARIGINNTEFARAIKLASNKVGGEGGGHNNAAGAIIPEDRMEEFIKELKIALRQHNILV